jgi:hypothetical protein
MTVAGHHPSSAGAAAATPAPLGRHPLLLLVTHCFSSIPLCSSLNLTYLTLSLFAPVMNELLLPSSSLSDGKQVFCAPTTCLRLFLFKLTLTISAPSFLPATLKAILWC